MPAYVTVDTTDKGKTRQDGAEAKQMSISITSRHRIIPLPDSLWDWLVDEAWARGCHVGTFIAEVLTQYRRGVRDWDDDSDKGPPASLPVDAPTAVAPGLPGPRPRMRRRKDKRKGSRRHHDRHP